MTEFLVNNSCYYACGFNQLETGKHFEWIIMYFIHSKRTSAHYSQRWSPNSCYKKSYEVNADNTYVSSINHLISTSMETRLKAMQEDCSLPKLCIWRKGNWSWRPQDITPPTWRPLTTRNNDSDILILSCHFEFRRKTMIITNVCCLVL